MFKIIGKCKKCGKNRFFEVFNDVGYCPVCTVEYNRQKQYEAKMAAEEKRKKEKAAKKLEEIHQIPVFPITLEGEKRAKPTGFECPLFKNITPKGNYSSFVAIDLETTGLNGRTDHIIEIGAVKFQGGTPIETFHTYINPGIPIPERATEINHITDGIVKDAPKLFQVLKSLDEFLDAPILIAHNAYFDLKFLYYGGYTELFDKKIRFIDTLEQAHRIVKKGETYVYTLPNLCELYRITQGREHSALSDAMAVGELFVDFVNEVQNG